MLTSISSNTPKTRVHTKREETIALLEQKRASEEKKTLAEPKDRLQVEKLEQERLKIEDGFHQELLAVNQTYRLALQHRKNLIRVVEDRAVRNLFVLEEQYATAARQSYPLQSKTLHTAAVKERQAADLVLSNVFETSLVDSYRMLASAVGLSGVTTDVGKYVSIDTPYNLVQPLVTYLDFTHALQQDPRSDIFSQFISDHNLSNNVGYDTFLQLIESVNGFRTQVHETMAKYNQALARDHGWENMPLTKQHLYCARHGASALDQTPWGIAKKEHSEIAHLISSKYYKQEAALKIEVEQTIANASLVYSNEIETIHESLAKALEKIDSETEWDILAAEIAAQSEAFLYYAHPLSSIPTQKETVVVQSAIQPKSNARYRPFFKKQISNPLSHNLPVIDEEVCEDDDPEICSILGV